MITWPTRAREPAELPGLYPTSKAPAKPCGSWGHRREAREIRRGRQEGPSQTRGVGEGQRVIALPTQAPGAC